MKNFLENFANFDIFELDKLEFLSTPNNYYKNFISLLEQSQDVYISTLFIDVHGKCKQIFDILKNRKKMNKKTVIILDKNRAQRIPDLLEYIKTNDLQDLFVFYNASNYKFLPYKIREIFSVMHSKLYIFDYKIILSGANLNDAYFDNRIDRYIVIENEKLAKYLVATFFENTEKCTNNIQKKYVNIECDSYIIKFEQKQELDVLHKIFTKEYDEVFLSTAYLNFTKEHKKILADKNMTIITSSPHTSTFQYNSNIEKFVIESYMLSTTKCITDLPNAKLYEYVKKDHTFHCKGLWCFGKDLSCFVIGSTNFNNRSTFRDIEVNFLIVTKNKEIKDKLKEEVQSIQDFTNFVSLQELENRKTGTISWLSQFFINKYL